MTSKGQFTIPKAVRQALQLNVGDRIELFVRDDGHVKIETAIQEGACEDVRD